MPNRAGVTITLFGQSSSKAKVLDFHAQTFTIPLALLDDDGRAAITALVGWAEQAGDRLHSAIAHVLGDLGDRNDTRRKAGASMMLHDYWRRAEAQFRDTLAEAGAGVWASEQIAAVFRTRLISCLIGAWEDHKAEFGGGTAALVALERRWGLIATMVSALIPPPQPRVLPFTGPLLAQLTERDEQDAASDTTLTPAAIADSLGVTRRHVTRIATGIGVGTRRREGTRAVWSFSPGDVAAIRAWFAEHGRKR